MQKKTTDLLIIGGGINGMGIAADAAGRGLSVMLCDKNDFGAETSSASSKLIHGGLRYLERLEFGLVRESLNEREVLLKTAPHLVHCMRFSMPYNPKLRSYWALRLGLFLYDQLGSSSLPSSSSVHYPHNVHTNPLCLSFSKGVEYSDCVTDDARLVIANAQRAYELGAKLYPRTELIQVKHQDKAWQAKLFDHRKQRTLDVQALICINATGPWADKTLSELFGLQSKIKLKCVKGSHIVVPKLYQEDKAYVLQHKDGRIIFVAPFQKQFSMVGTTDVLFKGNPSEARCSPEEIDYLCDSVSFYFHKRLKPQHVVSSWSGVRPLIDKSQPQLSNLSRESKVELLTGSEHPPIVNLYGGKLTTYRKLAEKVLSKLSPFFPGMKPPWTHSEPLPGGDIPYGDVIAYIQKTQEQYPFLSPNMVERLVLNYGTRCHSLLKGITCVNDLGQEIGPGLFEAELKYLIENEWVDTTEDVLWRRTKLGLFFNSQSIQNLDQAIAHFVKDPTLQRAVS